MNIFRNAVSLTLLGLSIVLPVAQAQKSLPRQQRSKAPLPADNTARVIDLSGKAGSKAHGTDIYNTLTRTGLLTVRTTLRTGEDSAVLLLLPGGDVLRVGEKTVVVLNELSKSKGFSCKVLSGQVWAAVRPSATKFEVATPSSRTSASDALFGVGYELEADQSLVSIGEGSANVSLPSGGWRELVKSGQYVRYLRNPQPNIRLRAPEVLPQGTEQKTMWQRLRSENWTKRNTSLPATVKLKRGEEKQLRQLTFSVSVEE